MECLNDKYNLDYYSSSESDSEFELEYKYETFNIKCKHAMIQNLPFLN